LQFHDLSVLTTLRGGGSDGTKLANLVERTVPAALLLAALACIVKFFGPVGVSCLLLLLSPILYQEACHVVAEATPINNNNRIASTLNAPNAKSENVIVTPLQQHQEPLEPATDATAASALSFSNPWWWFASYSCSLTLPSLLDDYIATPIFNLISFFMVTTGWISFVLQCNNTNNKGVDQFRTACRQVTTHHMALFMTLVPVAFWIRTIQEFGLAWALYAALLVICNDTAAYLFGVTLGKTAIVPVISPKKTWEGFAGAFVSTTALSWLVWTQLFDEIPYNKYSFVIALYCSLIGPFGGFLASTIKRAYGKKDFGSLIKGHGGLIDRLDCQLMTAPFVYVLLQAIVYIENMAV
jgi:phosphatidate cytidylyltransferase